MKSDENKLLPVIVLNISPKGWASMYYVKRFINYVNYYGMSL